MADPSLGLPPFSSGGASAGAGAGVVVAPNPVHLPPIASVPPGAATTEQSRPFASADTLTTVNGAADMVTAQSSMISAAGKYVPLSYGFCRWSGYVYFWGVHPSTGALTIGLLLCEGEIDSVVGLEIANAPLRTGCTFAVYTGTAGQAVDATITTLVPLLFPGRTYTDALPGLAHVVLTIPAGTYTVQELTGFDVTYYGKKVFDRRDGTQSQTNTATWKYSANAAVVMDDFMSSGQALARGVLPRYGRRCTMLGAGVTAVANVCDESIGNAPNLKRRSEVHLTIFDPTANEQIEQTLRTHALCYVDRLGDTVEMIADVARSPVATFDADQIIQYEQVAERDAGSAPTMMEATYTDTSVKPWRTRPIRLYDARVLTGEIPEIPGTVDLKWCQSYVQAQGILRKRLNTSALSMRTWGFSLSAEGYARQKSDVISATHPLGMTDKQWVLDTVSDRSFGEVHFKLSEYDEGIYSDFVQTIPATLGSGAANCSSVPTPAGLAATQRSVNELQSGGSWACILRANVSCTAVTFPCLAYYEFQVLSGATLIESARVGTNTWRTSALSTGTYTIQVRCVSALPGQAPGAWATTTITIASATCPPVAPQMVRSYGWNARRDVSGVFYNEFQRKIVCDAPLTTVTRTELWFAWTAGAAFGSAVKMRDDAGAQTAWTFWKGYNGNGSTYQACTIALGLTAVVPPATGYTYYSPGTATAGTYPNAQVGYAGTAGEWWPPEKVWVRFNNAGVFSDPVEVVMNNARKTYANAPGTTVYGYMADGATAVQSGTPMNATYTTDLASAYANSGFVSNAIGVSSGAYNYVSGSSHKITGQLYDTYGDTQAGFVQWQLWKL